VLIPQARPMLNLSLLLTTQMIVEAMWKYFAYRGKLYLAKMAMTGFPLHMLFCSAAFPLLHPRAELTSPLHVPKMHLMPYLSPTECTNKGPVWLPRLRFIKALPLLPYPLGHSLLESWGAV
jgi:hypothetical protein